MTRDQQQKKATTDKKSNVQTSSVGMNLAKMEMKLKLDARGHRKTMDKF